MSEIAHGALTRIVIVDDHLMVAEGVAALLSRQPDMEVLGIASSGAAGLQLVESHDPNVVIMDFNMPDQDGAEATRAVMSARPATTVIMYSAAAEESLLARALEAGCAGFISKTQRSEEILSAIRAAARGESIVPTATLSSLLSHLSSPAVAANRLTARELEVLQLLANGESTDKIAGSLYVSTNTVRNHVRNILTKLGAHSKLEAVAIAARDGVIKLNSTR